MPVTAARRIHPRLPRILLTGFDPFDGRAANRSWRWIEAFLRAARRQGLAHHADLAAACLPVDFVTLPKALEDLWRSERPDVWLLTGESGRGANLRVERVAVNLLDARVPDNAGRKRVDQSVVRGGPPAYFASYDPKSALRSLRAGGAPAALSLSAGSYCCNQAFYWARHLARERARVLFLHIPRLGIDAHRQAPRLADAALGLVRLVRDAARSQGRS